jgi:hypothetical protein
MFGLKRRKRKSLAQMTNAEAADYYVAQADEALAHGERAHAHQLFHTAVLHDSNNPNAREGFAATDDPARVPPAQAKSWAR